METPPSTEYKKIEVVGTVSVELIKGPEELRGRSWYQNAMLILGPTGAGKSTFVEALDSKKSLKISSNRLEGFTQSISLYRLINVKCQSNPIYLVDVPGFADTKISEMKIVLMLKGWMAKARVPNLWYILYFTPVNTPRLPGSHRQVLRTFQALTGVATSNSITVVSTMWDCVWNETGRKRAESNFNQLRGEIWKVEYVEKGTEILKFHNTQQSALSILANALDHVSVLDSALVRMTRSHAIPIRETSFGTELYHNLQQRIQNLNMEIANMKFDLLGAAERDNAQLTAMLVPRLAEAQKLLAVFEQELCEFGPPPANSAPVGNPSQSETLTAASQTFDALPDTPRANAFPIVNATSEESEDQIQEPASHTSDPILPISQTLDPIHRQPPMVLQADPSHGPLPSDSLPAQQVVETISTQATADTLRKARLARISDWMKRWMRKLHERLSD